MKLFRYLLIAALLMGTTNGYGQQPDTTDTPSLNDIRFGKWTDKDWLENDYFATLRTCLNDVCQGKTEEMYPDLPASLQPHLSLISTPFMVVGAEAFIMGGLYVKFVFPADPDKIFSTWIYGFIDPDTQEVLGYEVRGEVDMQELEMTEEDKVSVRKDIDQFIQDNPGIKWLW